jgi:hypothetical protein
MKDIYTNKTREAPELCIIFGGDDAAGSHVHRNRVHHCIYYFHYIQLLSI